MLPRLALTLALALLVCPRVAIAQEAPPQDAQLQITPQQYDTPAYVSVVDGSATLERDGRIESAPLNMPLLSGDRLRTVDGRLEVRFADGGRLHVDSRTTLDVLSDELVRLVDGRIRISMQRAQQVSYRVDSAAGSARITQPGEYRVALIKTEKETQLELAVVRGAGEIFTDQGSTPVRSGERAYASAGLMPSYAYTYNSANGDEFDRWSEMQRGTVYAASSQSSQYLPQDMSSYASTFDQYGDWQYQPTYGHVWYPRVASGWRPYYYGRWATYPTYGQTWIPGDAFGYPTHHYGRWGFSANAWFWIPSPYWGPAYVSWGYAPSYVSWCPLGWNNRAVFSIGYYNVGPAYYASHYRGHYYSAWTTVPRGYFGNRYYAHQYAVNWDRGGTNGPRPRFTEGRDGPSSRDVAVPRGSTGARAVASNVEGRNSVPVRFAGTRAVSNTGNPAAVVRSPAAFDGARTREADRRTPSSPPATDTAQARQGGRTAPTTETPRYINRGNEIVRSQTGRPIPPGDTAIARPNAQSAPAYRSAPSANDGGYRAYDRAVSRGTPGPSVPGGIDSARNSGNGGMRTQPQALPRSETPGAGAVRGYDRPSAGDRVYAQPSVGDRAFDRPSAGGRAYERPAVVDRAYERPGVPERAYERPSGGRVDPGAGRPMERSAPPSAAPAPRPGGDRAISRPSPGPGAGPGPGAQAPPSRAGGGGAGAPAASHRGGGRSR
jgi:Family of unknown function (DUF6600)/FecR protein